MHIGTHQHCMVSLHLAAAAAAKVPSSTIASAACLHHVSMAPSWQLRGSIMAACPPILYGGCWGAHCPHCPAPVVVHATHAVLTGNTWLLRLQNGRTALHMASWNGDKEVVRQLLLAGADANAADVVRSHAALHASPAGRRCIWKLFGAHGSIAKAPGAVV
jgi:hypothetical protein